MNAISVSHDRLPWHAPAVRQLSTAWQQGRWPHALLIHGLEGLGKRQFAESLAQAVLCEEVRGELVACGRCASCTLFAAQTHPDFFQIRPEEDKQQISVDQIREVCAALAMTSYRSGYKVALVDPAHQMTPAAANSLLKTLEEPASRTLLVLISSKPTALLPTIRSRCQSFGLKAPPERDAMEWLASRDGSVTRELLRFANGAPLRALALAKSGHGTYMGEIRMGLEALFAGRSDVTQLAKQWSGEDLSERLLCIDHWLTQQIRSALDQSDDLVTGVLLPSSAPALNISRVFACLDRVRELRAALSRTALQRELAVEAVLLAILDTFGQRR